MSGSGTGQAVISVTVADDRGAEATAEVTINILDKSVFKISGTEGNFTGTLDDGDYFSCSTANLGDIDVDGINDIAVGANHDDDGGFNRGAVWIMFLDTDGSVFEVY